MATRLIDHSAEVERKLREKILDGLELCGQVCEGYAVMKCPTAKVDGGNLKNSIKHKVVDKDTKVYVGTPVDYGIYVEFGTGKYYPGGRRTPWVYVDDAGIGHRTEGMKPRPYMKPALTDHKDEYKQIMDQQLHS